MPRYNIRSRTYRRGSDDSTEDSIDRDTVKGGDEVHHQPSGPKKEEWSSVEALWSGTTPVSLLMTQACTYHPEDHWSRHTAAYPFKYAWSPPAEGEAARLRSHVASTSPSYIGSKRGWTLGGIQVQPHHPPDASLHPPDASLHHAPTGSWVTTARSDTVHGSPLVWAP
jgi:hypothetical protein